MYRLHIANKNYSSWSLRPWILLKQRNIPFEEILSPFTGGEGMNEFGGFSPTGLVPCLKDGEQTIWDSLAISEYIAEQNPGCWPENNSARAWSRNVTCEMHSGFFTLRNQCPFNVGVRIDIPELSDELKKDIARLNAIWEQGLNRFGGPFLSGSEFTIVDAFYVPVAFRIQTYNLPVSNISSAYVTRLLNLDSVKAWETSALAETWREEAHEKDCRQVGNLKQDLRSL